MDILTLLQAVASVADFNSLQAWSIARAGELEQIAKADEAEKAAAVEAAEAAAKAHEEAVASFDPSKIDRQAAIEMGLTNGMPEWLIQQKYAAWKLAHPDA